MGTGTSLISSTQSGLESTGGGQKKGFEDQWLRHLEKAYFDRQTELLRSVPANADRLAGCSEEIASIVSQNKEREISDFAHSPAFFPVLVRSNDKQFSLHSSDVSAANQTYLARLSTSTNNSATFAAPDKPVEKTPPNKSMVKAVVSSTKGAEFNGELPESMTIISMPLDEGIHLVIRDPSLSKMQVIALLKQLREMVEASGQTLAAVSLNGEMIWKPDSAVDSQHGLDLTGRSLTDNDSSINKLL